MVSGGATKGLHFSISLVKPGFNPFIGLTILNQSKQSAVAAAIHQSDHWNKVLFLYWMTRLSLPMSAASFPGAVAMVDTKRKLLYGLP